MHLGLHFISPWYLNDFREVIGPPEGPSFGIWWGGGWGGWVIVPADRVVVRITRRGLPRAPGINAPHPWRRLPVSCSCSQHRSPPFTPSSPALVGAWPEDWGLTGSREGLKSEVLNYSDRGSVGPLPAFSSYFCRGVGLQPHLLLLGCMEAAPLSPQPGLSDCSGGQPAGAPAPAAPPCGLGAHVSSLACLSPKCCFPESIWVTLLDSSLPNDGRCQSSWQEGYHPSLPPTPAGKRGIKTLRWEG